MTVRLRRYLLVGALLAILDEGLAAQETVPAAADKPSSGDPYLDLRESEDRNIQRFAERYFNLVKLQAWTSANGKSTVNAKYVSHDPDLKTVTLAVVRGSGKNRVVKELAVEVAKLNKTCQSRVRQIATIQTKLDELAAEAKENPTTGEAGYGRGNNEYGAPMTDERGAQPASAYGGEAVDAEAGTRERATPATAPATPVIDPNDPDPLGFEEAASQAPLAAATDSGYGYFSRPATSSPAGATDPSQWAVSYPAFHANFAVTRGDRGEPRIDWGELRVLGQMNDIVANGQTGDSPDAPRRQAAELARELGEVAWEGGFVGLQVLETGEREATFDLPPLPEPLRIRFLVDQQSPIAAWNSLRPGEPVQIVGRLAIETPNEIVVRMRRSNAPNAGSRPLPDPGRH